MIIVNCIFVTCMGLYYVIDCIFSCYISKGCVTYFGSLEYANKVQRCVVLQHSHLLTTSKTMCVASTRLHCRATRRTESHDFHKFTQMLIIEYAMK